VWSCGSVSAGEAPAVRFFPVLSLVQLFYTVQWLPANESGLRQSVAWGSYRPLSHEVYVFVHSVFLICVDQCCGIIHRRLRHVESKLKRNSHVDHLAKLQHWSAKREVDICVLSLAAFGHRWIAPPGAGPSGDMFNWVFLYPPKQHFSGSPRREFSHLSGAYVRSQIS
jgi:hypothetical protein